jgi:hypothetical protein
MKLSDWQDGVPPCYGIWEIDVPEHEDTYYAMYNKYGWGVGNPKRNAVFNPCNPYPPNNNPSNPRKWRGLIDE